MTHSLDFKKGGEGIQHSPEHLLSGWFASDTVNAVKEDTEKHLQLSH